MKTIWKTVLCLLLALCMLPGGMIRARAEQEMMTSMDMARAMGNGINLGNTFEAYGHTSLGTGASPDDYARLWGQPITTREIIEGMKAAGFDTLRIPVAWTNTMDFEHDDFTIATAYLDRVQEVIDWALDAGMFVIVNDHWDGGWLGMFGSATEAKREKAQRMFVSIWTQVGERFRDYDERLIFEAANEEFGDRLNDTDWAEDSGTLSKDDCYRKVNELNQLFVDLIRAQGGGNATRFLLIPGYNTDINHTVDSRFRMPEDSANRLLLSVHYYDPAGYCLQGSLDSWGTVKDYEHMNGQLAKLEKFSAQGIGVIIGEYGVVAAAAGGSMRGSTIEYTENFLNNCDLYGYCPVLWDCNFQYQRRSCAMLNDELATLYAKRSVSAREGLDEEAIRTQAQAAMEQALAGADEDADAKENQAIAWLMFNSGNWGVMYSVGDTYNPTQISAGVKATDVEVTGPGVYTVGLDFTGCPGGYVTGTGFCALGLSNGELFYPGCFLDLKEIRINGEKYVIRGRGYTTSDDKKCTRVNLYNAWVPMKPDAKLWRIKGGNLAGCMPILLHNEDEAMRRIESLQVTFELCLP